MSSASPEKITLRHRQGQAYVYVRQSTPKPVRMNQESQRNQYALVQRALDLGWPREQVHVIDKDLGYSGRDSERPGFQELVAAVSLGKVGIILAYEASRLALCISCHEELAAHCRGVRVDRATNTVLYLLLHKRELRITGSPAPEMERFVGIEEPRAHARALSRALRAVMGDGPYLGALPVIQDFLRPTSRRERVQRNIA